MIFSPYLQGVPNAKNSYLYSRLMFLQSNAEHIPPFAGKKQEKEGEKTRREEGVDIKDCLIFCAICWLVLSQPSHYIMSKIVNKQITTAHQRPQWGSGTHCPVLEVSLPASEEEKTFVFIVHLNNIYIFVQRKRLQEDLYEPLSLAWLSIYGTCHSQDAEVPSLLFMTRLPIMAYHSLNGIQLFASEYRPVPFFSQIEAMSLLNAHGGLLLITDTYFDGWRHDKQSNLL